MAIAAAIVHEPTLVIADEPTGALDAERSEAVLQLFVELATAVGTTLVMATQSPEVAAAADIKWGIRNGVLQVTQQADLTREPAAGPAPEPNAGSDVSPQGAE